MACEHSPSTWTRLKKDLIRKSEGTCFLCDVVGPNLWACLENECNFVGCPESSRDHSSTHYEETCHAVAVNLHTFRVWCYSCKKEVFLREFFTAAEMKALKNSKFKKVPGTAKAAHKLESCPTDDSPSNEHALMISPSVKFASLSKLKSTMQGGDAVITEEAVRGLTGLRNLGNTCYMNAALQSLSNCPQLTLHFLSLGKFQNMEVKNLMAKSYYKLTHDMWSESRFASVSPTSLNSTFTAINPAFRGHQQQDTQEFLRCLMDRLHEEMKVAFPAHETLASKRAAGDAGNVVPQAPLPSAVSPNELVVDDAIAMSISSSSGESFQSCESKLESDDDETSSSPRDEMDALLQDKDFPKELGQLHSSGSPLFRSNSFPSIVTISTIKSDHNSPETKAKLIRKRTMSTRSSTQIEKIAIQSGGKNSKKDFKFEYRSVISDIYDGALRSSVQCKTCGSLSHTRETFQDLSLPIPGKDDTARLHGLTPSTLPLPIPPSPPASGGPCANSESYSYGLYNLWEWLKGWFWGPGVTLTDCLSAFFSADELKGENMYSCEKCKKLRNGMKYCRLLKLPEVLCIHLKRFRHEYLTSYSTKISSSVTFPLDGLDLSRYAATDCVSNVKTYDLSSVIVHQGGAGGGHYTAYCKSPLNGNWYEFDDQFVTQVTEATVANAEAYVLFYSKRSEEASLLRERVVKLDCMLNQPVLIKFYVSVEWIIQFLTFAEPGPIDNHYFLCRHGNVRPAMQNVIGDRVCCVSENTWHALHEKYGGGPAVTRLQVCSSCIREAQLLEERRANEHDMYMKHSEIADSYQMHSFYISMSWFRKWQAFLQGEKDPPGEIDNSSIAVVVDGKVHVKRGSDYGEITADAWKYLHSLYGGGPAIPRPVPKVATPSATEAMNMDVD